MRSFVALTGASLVVVAALFGLGAWHDYGQALRDAEAGTRLTTDLLGEQVSNVFRSDRQVAERIDDALSGRSWQEIAGSEQVRDALARIRREYPEIQAIWLADPGGIVRNASEPLPVTPVSVADREYFQALRAADQGLVVGKLAMARAMPGANFNVAMRRHGGAGEFNGVIILTVLSDRFTAIWSHAGDVLGGSTLLFHKDGAVLCRWPAVPGKTPYQMGPTPEALRAVAAGGDATFRAVSANDGVERIYTLHPVAPFGVYLTYGIGVSALRNGWLLGFVPYVVSFALAVAALVAFASAGIRTARREQLALDRLYESTQLLGAEVERRAAGERALRRSEEDIRALNRGLAQRAAELEAANHELQAFAYSVSHDLRAPLRAIDGFSLALLEDYADKLDAEGREELRRVRAASQRMATMIDDILNLSRVGRADMTREPVDLTAIARQVAADLGREQPQRAVAFVIEDGLMALGDARLLRMAMENLIGNAWKYSSRRASARIEVGGTDAEGGRRTFFVRDNGAGFDMAYVAKLFSVFTRLHSSEEFPGNGIGLALVQRIINRHGGTIWADGAVDMGATFYFRIETPPGESHGTQTDSSGRGQS